MITLVILGMATPSTATSSTSARTVEKTLDLRGLAGLIASACDLLVGRAPGGPAQGDRVPGGEAPPVDVGDEAEPLEDLDGLNESLARVEVVGRRSAEPSDRRLLVEERLDARSTPASPAPALRQRRGTVLGSAPSDLATHLCRLTC